MYAADSLTVAARAGGCDFCEGFGCTLPTPVRSRFVRVPFVACLAVVRMRVADSLTVAARAGGCDFCEGFGCTLPTPLRSRFVRVPFVACLALVRMRVTAPLRSRLCYRMLVTSRGTRAFLSLA